jgi:hypothetical protein
MITQPPARAFPESPIGCLSTVERENPKPKTEN